MALDLEEQEQLDALKAWWNQYGRVITTVIAVVAVGFFAYKGWTYHVHEQSGKASAKYDALVSLDAKDIKAVQAASGELIDEFASTAYAGRAALYVAKVNYEANDLTSAKAQLEWATKNAKEEAVKSLASLQLAGIQYEEKAYDEALKTLDMNHDEGFIGLVSDLKGDIYTAQGKKVEAKAAYQEALTKLDAEGRYHLYTEHKLEALGG